MCITLGAKTVFFSETNRSFCFRDINGFGEATKCRYVVCSMKIHFLHKEEKLRRFEANLIPALPSRGMKALRRFHKPNNTFPPTIVQTGRGNRGGFCLLMDVTRRSLVAG